MSRCKTCRFIRAYPRCRINQRLAAGASYRSISIMFPLAGTEMTIANHWKSHHWKPQHAKKERTRKCKTCAYIRSHPENSVNADLLKGVPYSTISYKTGLGIFTLKKHFEEQHMMAQFLPRSRAMKVGREQDSLLDKVNEIYEDCKDNAAKAKGKAGTSRDFRDASGCWDAATRALSILKPEEKQQVNQTTTVNNYDNLSKEELRAAIALAAKLQGAEEGISEEKPD